MYLSQQKRMKNENPARQKMAKFIVNDIRYGFKFNLHERLDTVTTMGSVQNPVNTAFFLLPFF